MPGYATPMRLLVLMYHRARAGRHGNSPEMLDRHFAHVAAHFNNVVPGGTCAPVGVNVCLTFDDAYFDFYATVFPLLEKHGLKALLAVPVSFIQNEVSASRADRLGIESQNAFAEPRRGGFCTWSELDELARSGRIVLAAHGYNHVPLNRDDSNLPLEIDAPAVLLRTKLGRPVDSFVFPFGRFNDASLAQAKAQYRHVFRIGGAINRNWDSQLLYRVDADAMAAPDAPLKPVRLALYRARFLWNRVRLR